MCESIVKPRFQRINRAGKVAESLKTVVALICLGVSLYCFGCSGANYGSLKNSRDVTQDFETYHVWPEYRYYYLNQENNLYAVVALQPGYIISDNRWVEFDPRTDKLEKVVDLVKDFPANYAHAYGAYLKDSMGNQIGYWYSSLQIRTLKVDNETKKVSIYTDSPWLQDDDRGFGTGVGIGIGTGGSGIGIRIGR
jgi:hypothetical protein